ncbi:MAG TPA: hypothetical protein VN414_07365 [Methanosarcina sp.]|nr:hypothetical protein [Methanosarcina sp.]
MDSMLTMPAGRAGHAAFSRFVAGTGGTEILGATSTLGALALKSPSFQETKQKVQADIAAQIAKMVPTSVDVNNVSTLFPLNVIQNLSLSLEVTP